MSVSDEATLFKFCTQMHHGLLLLADQKLCRNAPGVTEHMQFRANNSPSYIVRYQMKT